MVQMVRKDGMSQPERTLIYDGDCRLCVTARKGLERAGLDARVRYLPYQSEEAARCLAGAYQPGRPDVAFLVEQDGRISRGLDAFLPLLPGLRGGRFLLALLRIPLMRPLAHFAYRLIARYRYHLFGRIPLQVSSKDS
nr:DUF393 domain-containing protein [Nitrospirota bacterium]